MTLDDYIREQIAHLKLFEEGYKKGHACDPDAYPLDMWPGDWDEQVDMFEPE